MAVNTGRGGVVFCPMLVGFKVVQSESVAPIIQRVIRDNRGDISRHPC